ncbi:hypothetical protein ACNKHK_23280 [Shigella flexneri]
MMPDVDIGIGAGGLLCRLTGAEDACIVNNNAAAVLLMLSATANGKGVVAIARWTGGKLAARFVFLT